MNQTVVMTGATRGIGRLAAAQILADRPDTHLVLIARGDAGDVVDDLARRGGSVCVVQADLLQAASTRHAAEQIAARLDAGELPPLHGIVGNAGLQFTDANTETADGLEATFAVNVLANHVLIRGLQSHLTAPARVVVTVSDTHFGDFRHNLGMVPGPVWQAPDDLARPGTFARPETVSAGRRAYSTSKLAAVYLVHEYARRLPAGVDVISFNPGFVPGTGLARHAGPASRFAMRRILPALTATPLATSPAGAGRHLADVVSGRTTARSGEYVDKACVEPSSPESYDPERERALWDTVERLAQFAAPSPDRTTTPQER